MTRLTTVQREQHSFNSVQDSHSRQLHSSNDKSNKLDRRSGTTSGKLVTVDPPTSPPPDGNHCGAPHGSQRSSSTPDRQLHLPSTNYDWDMDTSGPISHDYPAMTQPDANVPSLSKPPNTFYWVAQPTAKKGKGLELEETRHCRTFCSHRREQKHSSNLFRRQE